MKNCFVAQSGGPTAAINASLAGVISAVVDSKEYDSIYGLLNGITGLFENRYINLSGKFPTPESLEQLKTTPAMYLGSCRFQLPDAQEDDTRYKEIFRFFKEHDVAAFFYIGGNDSMDTAMKLARYAEQIHSDIRIIGVPKTIDNDLVKIDHTPGFGSAAKYVASGMLEMAYDTSIYKLHSVTIVEIMGRDAGWLTLSSALARQSHSDAPHLIYLPEIPFSIDRFVEDVSAAIEKYENVLVAVSEGIRDEHGKYISATDAAVDQFGHSQLSGAAKTLEYIVAERIGVKVRSVELNIPQRCGGHLISKTDIDEAFTLGANAVHYAESGLTGVMASLHRIPSAGSAALSGSIDATASISSAGYEIFYGSVPLAEVANKVKPVPRSFISESGNDVTPEAIRYLFPLIQGEYPVHYENGLPSYVPIFRTEKNDSKTKKE